MTANVRPGFAWKIAWLANLAEVATGEPPTASDATISVEAAPRQIVTLRFD